MESDRPSFPLEKLRDALPEDHEGHAEIDALHQELGAERPEASRITAHVDSLKRHAPLSALITAWFEHPQTQAFIQELTAAGL